MQNRIFVSVFMLCSMLATIAFAADNPDYKKDLDRLQELRQMYGNASMVQSQPDEATVRVKELKNIKAERKRIEEKYKSDGNASRNLQGVLRLFDQQVGQFEQAVQQYCTPAGIDQEIDQALKMGADAVTNKRPLYFGDNGGVKQHLTWAQTRYNMLAALSPDAPETKTAQQKLDAAREQVKQMKASLNDAIIAANAVPREQYNGPDKPQLIEMVKKKWSESGVTGDVLKTGVNSREWKRDTYWRFDGTDTFNKNDTSKIQGFVVVKTDNDHATIHYINLVKDHLKNDSIDAFYFDDPKAEPDVSNKLLLKNVK